MITRLEIENFKAIRKVAIDLRPLTVLVGPNDSGKSTILQALGIVGRSAAGADVERIGGVFERDQIEYFRDQNRRAKLRIAVDGTIVDGELFRYEITFGWRNGPFALERETLTLGGTVTFDADRAIHARTHVGSSPPSTPRIAEVAAELSSFFVAFEPSKLSAPSPADAQLNSRGDGLPGVVDRLLTSMDRKPLQRFEQQLKRMSRHVTAVATRPLSSGLKELWFSRGDDGDGFSAREASSGLVLSAGYLALLHGVSQRSFLIEEPENGVHPHTILVIVDLLREIARGGKQVIATTHSPALLDYMEPEDVLIVTRDKDMGVIVTPAYRSRFFNEAHQRVDLGELWYSVGDEAIVSTAQ